MQNLRQITLAILYRLKMLVNSWNTLSDTLSEMWTIYGCCNWILHFMSLHVIWLQIWSSACYQLQCFDSHFWNNLGLFLSGIPSRQITVYASLITCEQLLKTHLFRCICYLFWHYINTGHTKKCLEASGSIQKSSGGVQLLTWAVP